MAFPTSVTTDGLNRGAAGPFISSTGNIYFVSLSQNAYDVRMWKATDPTSSFSNVGTDIVIGGGTDEIWSIAGYQVGDNIHVVTKNGVSDGTLVDIRYHQFDCSTDTWFWANTAIKSNMTLGTGGRGIQAMVDICVRGDGAIFIAYNGSAENVSTVLYERLYYTRNLNGDQVTWSSDIALTSATATAVNWRGAKMLLGGANRVHFFFQDITNDRVYERTLNTSNSLEPLNAGTAAPIGAWESIEQRGVYLSATDVSHFPFMHSSGSVNSLNFTTSDVPVVATDLDITGATNVLASPIKNVISYAANGNAVAAVFCDSNNDLYTTQRVSGSWQAPTLKRACSASAVYATTYTRSTALVMAFVYLDSGDHFYDEFTLSTLGVVVNPIRNGLLQLGVGR